MNDAFEAFEAFGRWDNASCLKKCVRNGIYILLWGGYMSSIQQHRRDTDRHTDAGNRRTRWTHKVGRTRSNNVDRVARDA